MINVWLSLALVFLALGNSALADSPPTKMRCEIRETVIPDGLRLESVVRGLPGKVGRYRLILQKKGSGGESSIGQGGAFTIAPSGEIAVSTNELSMSAHDNVHVSLNVGGDAGPFSCDWSR
jgi:hypothetical protein